MLGAMVPHTILKFEVFKIILKLIRKCPIWQVTVFIYGGIIAVGWVFLKIQVFSQNYSFEI